MDGSSSTEVLTGQRVDVFTHDTAAVSGYSVAGVFRNFSQHTSTAPEMDGVNVLVEHGAPSTLAEAYGIYNNLNNVGAGSITTGYTYFAASNPAATAYSYYAGTGAGRAHFADGARAPINSHNASSVLAITTNTIAPTNAIHHLGAGLVKTITVPATCYSACSIMIVPDAAFTTDTTGNVGIASTATTGRLMILAWDGVKWWPSY